MLNSHIKQSMIDALGGGDSSAGRDFASVLDALELCSRQWEIATEEIKRAVENYPEAEADLQGSFHLLRPAPEVSELRNDALYRGHCRELLVRVANTMGWTAGRRRKALQAATRAEVAVACSSCSFVSPINRATTRVYMLAMRHLFPEQMTPLLKEEAIPAEEYDGADAEVVRAVKLGDFRGLPEPRP